MRFEFFLTFCVSLILSGCATFSSSDVAMSAAGLIPQAEQPVMYFQDTQNRSHSDIVIDQARCGVINGDIPRGYEELYEACMDKHGYKLVQESK